MSTTMSEHLYPTLLRFDGGRGVAKVPGISRHFTHQPHIHGLPAFQTIDYSPAPAGVDHATIARIQPYDEDEREMTAAEARAVERWLGAMREGRA